MIQSMTGYGKSVANISNKKLTIEVKSLNSKQLDLSVKIPYAFRSVELEVRNIIAKSLQRGKVDLFVTAENVESNEASINIPLLKTYKRDIEQLSRELGIDLPTDWYSTLLRMPDALKADTSTEMSEADLASLKSAVKEALDNLCAFRAQEGEKLYAFFQEKIQAIDELLTSVEVYEAERVPKIKARIRESLAKLENIPVDENRFEQELIYYIEKLDITEEKIRLKNHLNYFLSTLDGGIGQGKTLGFIAQEMGREINTMGSKANQAEMQNVVVKMKDQLEQIKEQVLNVL